MESQIIGRGSESPSHDFPEARIKILKQREAPYVPSVFLKELKSINSNLFPLWIAKSERWVIASFVPRHVNKRGYTEEYAVSKGDEYVPLDNRTLNDLRRLFYLKDKLTNLDKHLDDMDEDNNMHYGRAYREYAGMRRECMKKLDRILTTKTFV